MRSRTLREACDPELPHQLLLCGERFSSLVRRSSLSWINQDPVVSRCFYTKKNVKESTENSMET